MNVYRFTVEFKATESSGDMSKTIIGCFADNSNTKASVKKNAYGNFVRKQWKIEPYNIQKLYSESFVCAYSEIKNTHYYLIQKNINDDISRVNFEVLVITEANDIDDSLQHVLGSLKEKVKKIKFTIVDNKATLFITKDIDIHQVDVAIKASIIKNNFKFYKKEIIRGVIMVILILCAIILLLACPSTKDACISFIVSCVLYIISELLLKIDLKQKIVITDLTNCMENQYSGPCINAKLPSMPPLVPPNTDEDE